MAQAWCVALHSSQRLSRVCTCGAEGSEASAAMMLRQRLSMEATWSGFFRTSFVRATLDEGIQHTGDMWHGKARQLMMAMRTRQLGSGLVDALLYHNARRGSDVCCAWLGGMRLVRGITVTQGSDSSSLRTGAVGHNLGEATTRCGSDNAAPVVCAGGAGSGAAVRVTGRRSGWIPGDKRWWRA
jgi:hypothetical protein